MFKLTVLTPDKKVVVGQEIEDVTVPAYRGELDILPGHAPLITTLSTGILRWREKGQTTYKSVVVSWGYCQINRSGVDILADVVDFVEDINPEADKETIHTNEHRLATESLDEAAWDELHRQVARARAHEALVKADH